MQYKNTSHSTIWVLSAIIYSAPGRGCKVLQSSYLYVCLSIHLYT